MLYSIIVKLYLIILSYYVVTHTNTLHQIMLCHTIRSIELYHVVFLYIFASSVTIASKDVCSSVFRANLSIFPPQMPADHEQGGEGFSRQNHQVSPTKSGRDDSRAPKRISTGPRISKKKQLLQVPFQLPLRTARVNFLNLVAQIAAI